MTLPEGCTGSTKFSDMLTSSLLNKSLDLAYLVCLRSFGAGKNTLPVLVNQSSCTLKALHVVGPQPQVQLQVW